MGKQIRSKSTPGGPDHPVPRWTPWEVLGLVVSAILVAAPLISLAYSFIFPTHAPAAELFPSPTPLGTPTPTYTPGGPTDTPAPTIPTDTPLPTIPTDTPVATIPTDTPVATIPTDTPPPTTPACGNLTVDKAADRDQAYPGDTIVFSIGLTNRTCGEVWVTLNDTLPAELTLANVWHTCAEGTITPGGGGFSANLRVPAGQACMVVAATTVSQGCNCYVRNSAAWNSGGVSGTANSQQIWLPIVTLPPATTAPVPPTTTPPVPPTTTPPVPPTTTPPVPPTTTPPVPPTTTPPVPPTTTPPVPPTTTPPVPPTTTPPVPPTTTPPVPPTPTPTLPAGVPTATPAPISPTRRPPRRTPEPTSGPTPVCAQARVSGTVCASGVTVTISSCCPQWSAKTTSNASGLFEFSALTAGTFTVSARGMSRTVRLEKCDSAVSVRLCPQTPGPTAPVTPVTAGPTVTMTLPIATPGVPITATQIPESREIKLLLEADNTLVQPGQSVGLQLTLHNGRVTETLRGVIIGLTLDKALDLLGAASAGGEVRLSGQDFLLTGGLVAAGQDLTVHLDTAVRPEITSGTVITLQATARTSAGDMVDSNLLRLEVWGEGTGPAPAGVTPLGAVTPVGGPEAQPTAVPTGPTAQPPALPPTGTGIPIVGLMLGSGVMLARQLRLRRATRKKVG